VKKIENTSMWSSSEETIDRRSMTKKELVDEAKYCKQLIPVETSIHHALLGPLTNATEMKKVLPDFLHSVIDAVMNSENWITIRRKLKLKSDKEKLMKDTRTSEEAFRTMNGDVKIKILAALFTKDYWYQFVLPPPDKVSLQDHLKFYKQYVFGVGSFIEPELYDKFDMFMEAVATRQAEDKMEQLNVNDDDYGRHDYDSDEYGRHYEDEHGRSGPQQWHGY